jgi:hypothetical protein
MYHSSGRSSSTDSGETLIEIMAAILIYGVGSVIALGSLRQKQATVDALVRSISESLNSYKTTTCTTANLQALSAAVTGAAHTADIQIASPNFGQGSIDSGGVVTFYPSGADNLAAGKPPAYSTSCYASGSVSNPSPADSGLLEVWFKVTAATATANGGGSSTGFWRSAYVVLGSPRG